LKRNTIKYEKLVRDKIPEIIESSGKKAIVEVLNAQKYQEYLNIKLKEEMQEYQESDSVEELADLVEVIYALLDYKGVTLEQFEKIRYDKFVQRGGFRKRLLLKEVEE
jgi:predicted house-cleaning noncanonical NTP pyrophosphatase (MazG superfamily)